VDEEGHPFEATPEQVFDDIVGGQRVYVIRVGDKDADVEPFLRKGRKFIKTRPGASQADNLLDLPQCWDIYRAAVMLGRVLAPSADDAIQAAAVEFGADVKDLIALPMGVAATP
jgi:hypothetical protein